MGDMVSKKTDTATCPDCDGSGVVETGNNDLPCYCPAGDEAVFNDARLGRVTGAELKRRGIVFGRWE